MSLLNIAHQARAQSLLQRAITRERMPHAYIFHGPSGVGKESLAVGLAELLLCESPRTVASVEETICAQETDGFRAGCGECAECRAVRAGTHPDLHRIYRQLGRQHPDATVRARKALDLGVDVIRHFVIERVGRTPIRGRGKVFILREADRMTTAAQNALLKTLEEPPGATTLILLVESLDRLLPTTLSRCQAIGFNTLPTAFIREQLSKKAPDLPEVECAWYARAADGSLGRACEWAGDGIYEINNQVVSLLTKLDNPPGEAAAKALIEISKSLGKPYRRRDPDITDTEAGRRGLHTMFQLAAMFYADVMRFAVCHGGGTGAADRKPAPPMNQAFGRDIERMAGDLDAEAAASALSRLTFADRTLDLNINTQLVVENLLNDLTRVRAGASLYV